MSRIETTTAARSALTHASDESKDWYSRARAVMAVLPYLYTLFQRQLEARNSANRAAHEFSSLTDIDTIHPATTTCYRPTAIRTVVDQLRGATDRTHIEAPQLTEPLAALNESRAAYALAVEDFASIAYRLSRIIPALLEELQQTPARKRTQNQCDLASLFLLMVFDNDNAERPTTLSSCDMLPTKLTDTLSGWTLYIAEETHKRHRLNYHRHTESQRRISRPRGQRVLKSLWARSSSRTDNHAAGRAKLTDHAVSFARAFAVRQYANYEQIGNATPDLIRRFADSWRIGARLRRLRVRPAQCRAWYQFGVAHNRIPGASGLLVSRPEAVEQVTHTHDGIEYQYTVFAAACLTKDPYRDRVHIVTEYWLDGPAGAPIPQSYHQLCGEETDSAIAMQNATAELTRRLRQGYTTRAESTNERRNRLAEFLQKIRRIAEITPTDSHRTGNCVPGTTEFMHQLDIKSRSVTGIELARRYRAAGYPQNPLFTRVIDHLHSIPSRLIQEQNQST